MYRSIDDSYQLKGISFLILLMVSLLIISAFNENNLAVFITGLLYMGIGSLFIIYFSTNHVNNSLFLFFLFFIFYLLHMSIFHYGMVYFYNSETTTPDEMWFYLSSNKIIPYLESGYTFFDVSNIYKYSELPAFIYLTGYLAILANEIGTNSVFLQKMLIVFFSSLIPVILYLILNLYVKEKIAVYGTIIYGTFTHLTGVSALLLRDVPVALTYIIVFWIILQKPTIRNIFLLLFTFFVSYFLRYETGVFLISMAAIPLIPLFDHWIQNKLIKKMFLGVGILFILVVAIQIDAISVFLQLYKDINIETQTNSAGSLGASLAALPFGLNFIGMALFSQLLLFPFWFNFKFQGFLSLFTMISGITWVVIWGYTLYGIVKIKILQEIDVKLKISFYYAILYVVLLASTEPMTRRLMAVYPIIFIVALLSFMSINNKERKIRIFQFTLFIYFLLTVTYLLLKSDLWSGYTF
jgi:hypothetical protein